MEALQSVYILVSNAKINYFIIDVFTFFRDVLVLLLWSMLNDKQPFEMRCAVLYCFQCFLYKNDFGKMKIVQKLLPVEKEGFESHSDC